MIEQEEIPKKNDIVYITQSLNQIKQKGNANDDINIIFCIDNSGSMSSSTQIQGKVNLKHGLSKEEYNMLKQFLEPGAEYNQYFPKDNQNIS